MPKGPIPDRFHDLLERPVLAFVSTLGKSGDPQTTPIWFLWQDESILLSLIEDRQKYRNLRRDPRISVVFNDPANPTRYLEVRGDVEITPDPDEAVFEAISRKYTGDIVSLEPPGTVRYMARVNVLSHTFQDPITFANPDGENTRA